MVTTRSASRAAPGGDEGPHPGNASVSRQTRNREPLAASSQGPATRSSRSMPAPRPASNKRGRESATSVTARKPKRPRRLLGLEKNNSNINNDNDDGDDDDDDADVDAALAAMSRSGKRTVEIGLTSRATRQNNQDSTQAQFEPPVAKRLRARRFKGKNSIEIFGRIAPSPSRVRERSQRKKASSKAARQEISDQEPEEEEEEIQEQGEEGQEDDQEQEEEVDEEGGEEHTIHRGEGHSEPRGSPELQTSPPPAPRRDPYEIESSESEEEDSNPALTRRPQPRNNTTSPDRTRRPTAPENPASRGTSTRCFFFPQDHEQSRRSQSRAANGSPRRVAAQSSQTRHNQEDSDSDDSDASGLLVEPAWDVEEEDGPFPGIQIRPYKEGELTIHTHGGHINGLSNLVGKPGWTGAGQRWRSELVRLGEPPVRTQLASHLFTAIGNLKDFLDDIPRALDLVLQAKHLADNHLDLHRAMDAVYKSVRKIGRWVTVPEDEGTQADERDQEERKRYRVKLAKDMTEYGIPMMVVLLQSAYSMGAEEPDSETRHAVPDEAVFTWTTVQYLMTILGWLGILYRIIKPLQQPNQQQHQLAADEDDPEDPIQNRERFGVAVRTLARQIREAVDEFNEQAEIESDRQEKIRRDAAIRAQRKAEEERERAERQARELAFIRSLQEIANRPPPLAAKFWQDHGGYLAYLQNSQKQPAMRGAVPPSSSRVSSSAASTNSSWPQVRVASGASQAPRAPRPRWEEFPPWDETETRWFLRELLREDRQPGYLQMLCYALNRPMDEILAEKERLKSLGLYSSPESSPRR
ncbi:hypothetical protein VTJ04DRAFT_6781 [Mycothermus thermophilus]|uniref:uncharacterized protein n=1 Tax=Humicola insolens TaxID=85995 RepID=UPI003742C479